MTVRQKMAADEARACADDRSHVFHAWSAQALIDPPPVNRYLGHQHPDLVDRAAGSPDPAPAAAVARATIAAALDTEVTA